MSANISIIGNLGKTPETKITDNGTLVASFSMASNSFRNGAEGRVEKTDWFRVTAEAERTRSTQLNEAYGPTGEGWAFFYHFFLFIGIDRYNPRSMPTQPAYIDARRLTKVFPTPAGDFMALKGIDLQANRGEFVAVIGKSGSGKSTLINMLTGIDRPTGGEIHIGGEPLHIFDEEQLAAWRGRNLGIVFQFFQLLPTLTLVENVMLPIFCRHSACWRA